MTTLFSDILSEVAKQAAEDYDLNIDSGIGFRTTLRYIEDVHGQLTNMQAARVKEQYVRWYRPAIRGVNPESSTG